MKIFKGLLKKPDSIYPNEHEENNTERFIKTFTMGMMDFNKTPPKTGTTNVKIEDKKSMKRIISKTGVHIIFETKDKIQYPPK
jgi:hypothetical protein